MKKRSKKFFLHSSNYCRHSRYDLFNRRFKFDLFFRRLKHGDDNYTDIIKNVHAFTFDGKNIAIGVSDD